MQGLCFVDITKDEFGLQPQNQGKFLQTAKERNYNRIKEILF